MIPARRSTLPGRDSLYSRLLGDDFDGLHPTLRRFLTEREETPVTRAAGLFRIRRGRGLLARGLAALMRAPTAGEAVSLELVITRSEAEEVWERCFGGRLLRTTQSAAGPALLCERIGPFDVLCTLEISDGRLSFRQHSFAVRAGPLALRLPAWLAPRLDSVTWAEGDSVHVVVEISTAYAGLVVGYDGCVPVA